MMQKKYFIPVLLFNCHLCGLIGLLSPFKDIFLLLTPMNLLLGTFLLFYYQNELNKKFFGIVALIFLIGFGIEVIGVQSGLIFGSYTYGETLGIKLLDVPLIMGINWLTLIYSVGVVLNQTTLLTFSKCLIGAGLLVILDFFIEPVAIAFDFWHWQGDIIPVQNFIAWFIISFFLLLLFYTSKVAARNRLGTVYLSIQFFFFISLRSLI